MGKSKRVSIWGGAGYFLIVAMMLIMAVTGVMKLIENDWKYASLSFIPLALSIIPFWLHYRRIMRLPLIFLFLITLFMFLSFFLGEVAGMYLRWWPWDDLLHFASGILLALAGFLLLYNPMQAGKLSLPAWAILLFAFSFSVMLGAMWEIVEFASDQWLGTRSQDNAFDTMMDFIWDSLGSLVTVVSGAFYLKGKEVPVFSKLVKAKHRGF